MRDPEKLGEAYLDLRALGVSISTASSMPAPAYTDGGHISSDPALHHSKTRQDIGNLDDGGAS
jgi:hypothetical protein